MRTLLVSGLVLGLLLVATTSRAQDRVLRFESDRETLVSVEVGSHVAWRTFVAGGYVYGGLGNVADYHDLCFTPCQARLPSRVLQLQVHRAGGGALWPDPIDPPDGSTVRVNIHHRSGERTAGMTIFVLGWPLAGGLALGVLFGNGWADGVEPSHLDLIDDGWEQALWISSAASLLLSWIVGLSLIGARDSADLEIIPHGVRF